MTPERLAFFNRIFDNRQVDLTLVNDGIHKQQNLSAIVRSCDAMGVGVVHRVFDDRTARTFRGTAMGSQKWVDIHTYSNVSDAIVPLKESGMQIVAAHLCDEAVDYREIDYTKPTAIVVGNERFGVSDAGMSLADHAVTIPMYGAVESFNVSVASAIILAEAQRQRAAAGMYGERKMAKADVDRIMFEVSQPALAEYCQRKGLDYPELDENGELINPQEWVNKLRGK